MSIRVFRAFRRPKVRVIFVIFCMIFCVTMAEPISYTQQTDRWVSTKQTFWYSIYLDDSKLRNKSEAILGHPQWPQRALENYGGVPDEADGMMKTAQKIEKST